MLETCRKAWAAYPSARVQRTQHACVPREEQHCVPFVPPEGLGASRLTGEERRDSNVESGAMVSEDLAPRKDLERESPS
jgi:hypothetical protein